MNDLVTIDVEYHCDGERMLGCFCAPGPVAAHNPRSAARARASTLRFLDEVLPVSVAVA